MGAELREQVAALKNEVSELRSELKTKSAIAEMEMWLDKIEERAARPPLKAIGKALTA